MFAYYAFPSQTATFVMVCMDILNQKVHEMLQKSSEKYLNEVKKSATAISPHPPFEERGQAFENVWGGNDG